MISRREMLTATATGAMVTAATSARAASFRNPDEPPQGAINAKNPESITDPGPQNPAIGSQFPLAQSPPATEVGDLPQFYKAGRSLTNLWVEYAAAIRRAYAAASPYSYGRFTKRRLLWLAGGAKDYWKRPGPPRAQRLAANRESEPQSLSLEAFSGLAFLDEPGTALQSRKGALCVRFKDGSERHFRPGEHALRTVIIAASASITAEALAWAAREHMSVLMARTNGEALSVLADAPAGRSARRELTVRRRQFEAVLSPVRRFEVAAAIVTMKVKALALSRAKTAGFFRRLTKARPPSLLKLTNGTGLVQDLLAIEAEASALYWRRWKGFALTFKDDVPHSWRTFQARVRFWRGGRLGEKPLQFGNRHAAHPMNAMLNYSYQVALGQMTRAIAGVGLDPCFGFLHSEKPGRLSLSYDVLELIPRAHRQDHFHKCGVPRVRAP
jgi:CRISPR-associated endonuclease Cas1